jgi:hypothetical protein
MAGFVDVKKVKAQALAAFGLANLELAEELLERAKAEVPVLTGQLRDSGHIRPGPDIDGTGTYEVVFDTPYALKQHEAQHFEHPKGGKAKYLEDPLKEMLPRFEAELLKKFEEHRYKPTIEQEYREARATIPDPPPYVHFQKTYAREVTRTRTGQFARYGSAGGVTRMERFRRPRGIRIRF